MTTEEKIIRAEQLEMGDLIGETNYDNRRDAAIKVDSPPYYYGVDPYGDPLVLVCLEGLDFVILRSHDRVVVERAKPASVGPVYPVGTVARFIGGNIGTRLDEGTWGFVYPHSANRYDLKFAEGCNDEDIRSDIFAGFATIIFTPEENA